MARATKKAQSDDVEFAKQVPVHPRDRLARVTKKDIEFLRQIPSHQGKISGRFIFLKGICLPDAFSKTDFKNSLEQLYIDVENNRKNKKMRLYIDNEFLPFKLKNLNDRQNVTMFTISLRGGKAFAAEQKT